jgi:hypothetical protein
MCKQGGDAPTRVAGPQRLDAGNSCTLPDTHENFAALEIGTSLQKAGASWWIVLKAHHTKTDRADERPIPDFLTGHIDHYVGHHRANLSNRRSTPTPGSFGIPKQAGQCPWSASRRLFE